MLKFLEKHKVGFVYIPLVIYWLLLITATSLPAADLPSIGTIDKVNHFIAYFGLAILLTLTFLFQLKYESIYKKAYLVAFLIVIFYGMLDEIHQLFIPGRDAEFFDWLADAAGAFLGVSLVWGLVNWLKYKSFKFDQTA